MNPRLISGIRSNKHERSSERPSKSGLRRELTDIEVRNGSRSVNELLVVETPRLLEEQEYISIET